MAGELFDVYVVGAADPSPSGVTRLAEVLAGRRNVPVASVARAITDESLRAGQGLTREAAEALARKLQSLGALTALRPAAGAPSRVQPSAAATPGPASALPGLKPLGTSSFASAPPSGLKPLGTSSFANAAPSGLKPLALGTPAPAGGDAFSSRPASAPALAPLGLARSTDRAAVPEDSGARTTGTDPFAPLPSTGAGKAPALRPPTGSGPSPLARAPAASGTSTGTASGATSAAADDPFAPPGAGEANLALGLATVGPDDLPKRPDGPGTGGPALEKHLAPIGAGGRMALAPPDDDANLHSVRCPLHGLLYDKSKAKGCRKCLEPTVAAAREIEDRVAGFRLVGFRENPARRAFLGLFLALLIGLLPAAYHALRPGAAEVNALRAEQEELSRRPGTAEILRRFDELDGLVDQSRQRAMRTTFILWAAVSGVAFAGWFRIT